MPPTKISAVTTVTIRQTVIFFRILFISSTPRHFGPSADHLHFPLYINTASFQDISDILKPAFVYGNNQGIANVLWSVPCRRPSAPSSADEHEFTPISGNTPHRSGSISLHIRGDLPVSYPLGNECSAVSLPQQTLRYSDLP